MNRPFSPAHSGLRHLYDPLTGQMVVVRPRPHVSHTPHPMAFGAMVQAPPLPPGPAPLDDPAETFTLADLGKAIKHITPTLLLVGIATGAAFAIGSGLVSHFLFDRSRRR